MDLVERERSAPDNPTAAPMETACPECARLNTERDIRQLTYTTTALRLKAAEINEDAARCVELRTKVEEANLELKGVNAEIAHHQVSHAVPNGGRTSAGPPFPSNSPVGTRAAWPPRSQSDPTEGRSTKLGIGIFLVAYVALLVWFVRMINGF